MEILVFYILANILFYLTMFNFVNFSLKIKKHQEIGVFLNIKKFDKFLLFVIILIARASEIVAYRSCLTNVRHSFDKNPKI